jgi:N-succinyldiaminopimelate aminotransferase
MPFSPASRVASFGVTIFAEMTQLAMKHQAINLSQGFPDFDGPEPVKEAAMAAIRAGDNQYAVSSGQPALRRAIAAHVERFYGQRYDPDAEITVTSGATEGLFSSTLGLVNPGDEVIIFEPFYDAYAPNTIMAGGAPRFVPLRPPGWSFDPDELASAFNNRTRLIIVNTPHNPTGKVFTEAELKFIAELCQKWNVIAMSDEVYEHIVFSGVKHVRLAQLPGMAERTLTLSSHGKTFSFTGWKIGWVLAPPDLTLAVRRAHQFVTFASGTPFQAAAVVALGLDDEYYQSLITNYQLRRDYLAGVLQEAGLRVSVPDGAYFIMADFSTLGHADDVAFCRWLTTEVGVAAIPPSAFYSDEHKHLARRYARFAFCKKMETLEKAAERLKQLKKT